MNMKKLLMGSLALAAIGGASSVGLYYQSLTMERKEKKRKADAYYLRTLGISYKVRSNCEYDSTRTFWNNDIKKTKRKMKQDGYSNAEIAMLYEEAKKALDYWDEK